MLGLWRLPLHYTKCLGRSSQSLAAMPTLGRLFYMQVRLVDPDGRIVQDLWSSKSLTVEVLLDGEAAESALLPEVPLLAPRDCLSLYPRSHSISLTRAQGAPNKGIGWVRSSTMPPPSIRSAGTLRRCGLSSSSPVHPWLLLLM